MGAGDGGWLVCLLLAEVIGNGWEGISDEYSDNMYIYVNSASDVIAKGFELEMDYDAGFAFG
ncbi:hypothetical protein ACSLOE_27725, partial [Escherichia coli]|uniref:hypothetical protein n=1 Tax=Escherichia coli TaxID=562 RepID=UPI003EDEB52C